MEKLGCEYCKIASKDLIQLDGNGKTRPNMIFGNHQIFINDNQIYLLADDMENSFVNINYCPMCGRNLKTNNPMIEVKPLEFPSWEEFQ